MSALLLAFAACGPPITNDPFQQEGAFQAVLPSMRRHGPPSDILLGPIANPLLEAAKLAATEHAALLELPAEVGDVLRATTADVRTDRSRVWEAAELPIGLPAVMATGKGTETSLRAWIRAEIVDPVDGDYALTIALALAPNGPFEPVGTGTHDGLHQGELRWDLAATATALEVVAPHELGMLEVVVDDRSELYGDRHAEVSYGDDLGRPWRTWQAVGTHTLAFEAPLVVTEDELPRPGWAVVTHDPALGGVAEGAVLDGKAELPFEACWSATGTLTFSSGPAPVVRMGSRSSCPSGF